MQLAEDGYDTITVNITVGGRAYPFIKCCPYLDRYRDQCFPKINRLVRGFLLVN